MCDSGADGADGAVDGAVDAVDGGDATPEQDVATG